MHENGTQHEREARFHDNWAEHADIAAVAVRAAFEAPTALENRYILTQLGPLRGRRILDVGCGLGEASVYFALQGAAVTATDISPGMVDFTLRLAKHHGVRVEGVVSAAESLRVPEAHFDALYAANLLHHVADRDAFLAAAARALKPGGRFFSWDPLAYNPVINVYRRMATAVRSADERPLTYGDVARARGHFEQVTHREFWIAALSLFLKYYLIDRVHPAQDRYWKRILRHSPASLWWWYPCRGADALLTRLPLLRRLAWNIVICGRKGL
ncbi:MAG: class I SAM-dependent methyltransferase [Planctomycetota bacterium]